MTLHEQITEAFADAAESGDAADLARAMHYDAPLGYVLELLARQYKAGQISACSAIAMLKLASDRPAFSPAKLN